MDFTASKTVTSTPRTIVLARRHHPQNTIFERAGDVKRRTVDRRVKNVPQMRETDNDRTIVRLIHDYRLLSQAQLERLLGRSSSTVQRLLRRLYDHRYLDRAFLPVTRFGSSPVLYILDTEGIALLRRMGVEGCKRISGTHLSPLFLRHTLAINEVRMAITKASEVRGWTLAQWRTENELKANYDRVYLNDRSRRVALIPDSFFSLDIPEKGTMHFFLELDRGTMTSSRFRNKVAAYISYYKNGGFRRRFGAQGFRVLTVVDGVGRGRTETLMHMTSKMVGSGRRFWFAELDALQSETILTAPVWQIAGADSRGALVAD